MLRDRVRGSGGNGAGASAPRWLQVLIGLVGLGVIGLAAAGATGYGVYRSYANGLESPDIAIAKQPSGGAEIYDRNGNLLYQYVDDRSGLRSPVKLADISPWMIAATISTEDASFWSNPGVNTRGLIRAGLEAAHLRSADAASNTGGSSITQQLVKNIYIAQADRSKRSYSRKAKETIYAIELSRRYSKDQILEWYLNQISYGGLYNGVEAASLGYFGKHAKDLTLPEAALLAGIPAGPVRYDPVTQPQAAIERRNEVLRLMHSRNSVQIDDNGTKVDGARFQVDDHGGTVDTTNAAFYLSTLAPLNITPQRFPVQAPHFVFNVIQPQLEKRFGKEALYRGGLRVTTTLDMNLERKAQDALEHWISEFEDSSDARNGALVAMDPRTSEILTYVGSRDYFNEAIEGQNDNADSLNSPGSTLKPFTYTTAFEKLGWGPGTEILDTPISFPDGDKVFTPRNPVGDFHGPISVHDALGNSLNIPAFKTALYAGVPNVVAEYKKFGMTTLDGHTYGPSVTLGGVDIKLRDVVYAYTVLASNGVMRGTPTDLALEDGNRKLDPVSILQITRADGSVVYPTTEDHRVQIQEEKVVDPQFAYLITSILSDPSAFCITYGCGALSIGRPWGVKTGTSEPFEDSHAIGETWTYGYTPDLVAGVWAGNSDNSPVHNITSTSISYRAVRDFMTEALADTPVSQFEKPGGLSVVDTCTPSGLKASSSCGRRVKNLLPDATAPKKDDDWWKRVRVDIRDGLIATELTPPQFVQERYGLAIPSDVPEFARGQALEWARYLSAGTAPTQKSTGDPSVSIIKPKSGDKVKGKVAITGKADSPDFTAYRIEFGAGNPPLEWTMIARTETMQPGGGLGFWDTTDLPDGLYTLRVVVEDKVLGELSTFVVVSIGSSGNTRTSPTPVATPTPLIDLGGR
ncbi:MAG: penicillin-binding protein [Chloroflexota bacterium]|nr:penicillin-binding protein [Chloroflexota bacterium]